MPEALTIQSFSFAVLAPVERFNNIKIWTNRAGKKLSELSYMTPRTVKTTRSSNVG